MNAPIRRDYRLHEFSWQEFDHLCTQICVEWLGEGFTPFAPGPDGGRDGKFKGTANNFPSSTDPLIGHAVLQAKHTTVQNASCSDNDFERLLRGEEKKINTLIGKGICEHYLVFTNRKYTGASDEKIIKTLEKLGLTSAYIVGNERLKLAIDGLSTIRNGLPNRFDEFPFRFNESDASLVVSAFHEYVQSDDFVDAFDSARDFNTVAMKEKNKLNGLSSDYYEHVIVSDSMPYFESFRHFLENPRNRELANFYHDSADELKQKIIAEQSGFGSFDHVLNSLAERIQASDRHLAGKRRLVSVLVHYMYCNCDIGKKAA